MTWFSNFADYHYSPLLHVYSRWHGPLASEFGRNDAEGNPIEPEANDRTYLAPDLLLSFYPHIDPNLGPIVKLYAGWKILNTGVKRRAELGTAYDDLGYHFGFVVNDQITEECIDVRGGDLQTTRNGRHDNVYLDYQFSRQLEIDYGFEDPDKNYLFSYFTRPIKFPVECFSRTEWNHIRMWWTTDQNKKAKNVEEIAALDIYIRWPRVAEINLDLTGTTAAPLIHNPFLFRIMTSTDSTAQHAPKVIPLGQQEIEIVRTLEPEYIDLRHLENLLRINYQAMHLPEPDGDRSPWVDLFRHFLYEEIAFDLEHFRKDAPFLVANGETTITQKTLPELTIPLYDADIEGGSSEAINFDHTDNSDLPFGTDWDEDQGNTLTWKVGRRHLEMRPRNQHWWNEQLSQWTDWHGSQLLMPTIANLSAQQLQLQTTLKLSTIGELTINVHQRIMIRNESFSYLTIVESDEEIAITDAVLLVWWMASQPVLQELRFTEWRRLAEFAWDTIEERR